MKKKLYDYLLDKYSDNLVISTSLNGGNTILGKYKNYIIRFLMDNDMVMVSIEDKGKMVLNDFIVDITKYLELEPMCKYDIILKEEDNKDIIYSTIEWRSNNIKERLVELVNNDNKYVKIENIIMYNSDNIDKYKNKIFTRRKKKNNKNIWYNIDE